MTPDFSQGLDRAEDLRSRPQRRASSGARILLLMTNRKSRELLAAWLGLSYSVAAPVPDVATASEALREGRFDLVILDGPILEELWYDIRTLREEQPEVFMPFLLVTSRQNIGPDTTDIWRLIDEILVKPIEKVELHARVEILLRARRYSLLLQTRYYSLAELAPVGIVRLDREGVIEFANAWVERILGFDRTNLIGKRLDDLQFEIFDANGRELLTEERPFYRILNANRRIYDQRISFFRPDGTQVHLSINGAPISTSDGSTGGGVMLTVMDVTKQAEYEAELRNARDQAEEMSRLKSAFLANMSHEIRTPLTGIISFSEIIAREVTGELREFAEFIQISGDRLMETFDSLIDLAQLESSDWTFSPQDISINRIVLEALSRFEPQAANQGLEFRIEAPEEPLVVRNDPEALQRVLRNLMSNAIKFTASGHIVVRLEEVCGYAQISIEDTGIGISEEFIPNMFDAFQQESQGTSRHFEGNGLGLTVTKQLVALMGGDIEVVSQKGVGSTFRVRLPVPVLRDAH